MDASADLTPRQIVAELDKFIVGQPGAKRAVAIALRNRYRRRQLQPPLRDEVIPKNILMIGPTGVGKTEIARRLARLASAPFVKVEATKFTEVGYVGKDVDSMIRDLAQISYQLVESEKTQEVRGRAAERVEERLLDLLHPLPRSESQQPSLFLGFGGAERASSPEEDERQKKRVEQAERIRARLKEQLEMGVLDDRKVEVEVEETGGGMSFAPVFTNQGMEEMGFSFQEMLGNMMPGRKRTRRVTVAEARELLIQEEARKLIDQDAVKREAVQRAEQDGIIFIDEIDKVASRGAGQQGPDVSRGGVQRDILPIIEGSTVQTKYGPVRTDHILFIAAGAFHVSKPSDLIPELQGRLPIRVELDNLTEQDFRRILSEPENALTKQYTALLGTEGVSLEFTDEGISELARVAAEVNQRTENIGARRLHTILERLLEDVSFDAPEEVAGTVTIDAAYVRQKLDQIATDQELARYIL
ncbi:MAG: ATP-dependent protease ATPase subunit HslU [Armatimonadota bacterium]